jgi:pyruvate dehydrogenase E2 component (dihydrolipoamide acetyltransferase)
MAAIKEVLVPDIGDFKDVPVIEILVKPGDPVAADASVVTLESDKATMEVPTPHAGVVRDVRVKVGDKVAQGTLLMTVEATEAQATAAPPPPSPAPPAPAEVPAAVAPQPVPAAAPAPASASPSAMAPASPAAIDEDSFARAHASPAIRRFARELGVDLGKVRGSGPKGRILREDVQGFVKQALAAGPALPPASGGGGIALGLPAWPVVDFAKFGPVETQPMSRIKKISGPALHRNWVHIPHITQQDEADITELEAFRKAMSAEVQKQGVKLTPLAFIMKAVVAALRRHPEFNSSLAPGGDALVLKRYFNIGVAVDTPGGLVVPVIREVDQKGVVQLAKELGEVSARARDGKLGPADMQGGTFSISSLGGIGGTHFTPIINAPEVAILGISRSAMKPVWMDGQFVPRLMLPLSLSYDHRAIDGAEGARFITTLNGFLADIRRVLL